MREALEAVGEFLSRCGALESANAVVQMLHKLGVDLPESSPLRWRALLAAIRQELESDPMDFVFLFERLLQLEASMPSTASHALLGSPIFRHLLVERFALVFEGLDAELFKLESDELCHAEGVYDTCVLIRDKIEAEHSESELSIFLAGFKKIFEQDEPKEYWDAFFERYHLNGVCFRRDLKRALCLIEATTLGPTKIELAFPSKSSAAPRRKIVPRALLEKRFGGSRQDWRDLSDTNSIADAVPTPTVTGQDEQQDPQQVWSARVPFSLNGEATASSVSDEPEQAAPAPSPSRPPQPTTTTRTAPQEPVPREDAGTSELDEPEEDEPAPPSSRPPRAAETARAARQESRRSVQRPPPIEANGIEASPILMRRRPRKRWSEEEEAALLEGYGMYGTFKNTWMLIKARFPDILENRSNVDLKDKYRNMLRYGKIPQPNATAAADE